MIDVCARCSDQDALFILETFPANKSFTSSILAGACLAGKISTIDLFFDKRYNITDLNSQFLFASSKGNVDVLNKLVDLVKWRGLTFPILSWICGTLCYVNDTNIIPKRLDALYNLYNVYKPQHIPTKIWEYVIDKFVEIAWIDGLIWVFKGTYCDENLFYYSEDTLEHILTYYDSPTQIQEIIDHIASKTTTEKEWWYGDRILKRLKYTDSYKTKRSKIYELININQYKFVRDYPYCPEPKFVLSFIHLDEDYQL